MAKNSKSGRFDLEARTTDFAKDVIRYCKKVKINPLNVRIIPQVVASAGSIGANYREANDALGKKDFVHRLKIARKEAKELKNILSSIISKC